jgi:hypothetical protein
LIYSAEDSVGRSKKVINPAITCTLLCRLFLFPNIPNIPYFTDIVIFILGDVFDDFRGWKQLLFGRVLHQKNGAVAVNALP